MKQSVAPFVGLTLLLGLLAWGPSLAAEEEPEPRPDVHLLPKAEERECFARWDEVLDGWWVLSPGSIPSCNTDRGDVICEPAGGMAKLVRHEFPDGRLGYRCSDDIEDGAGCLFVPHDPNKPFVCEPRSGTSLLCTAWKPDWDCAREVRKAAGADAQLTKLDYAHCEHDWQVRVWTLYSHDDQPMECWTTLGSEGDQAECRGVSTGSKVAVHASCAVNGGTGSCISAVGPGDCSVLRHGPLGGPYKF